MGFSLSLSSLKASVGSEAEVAAFLAYLREHRVHYNDVIDTDEFGDDFFDWDDDPEFGVHVTHPEVGWSWWSKVQVYLTDLLGDEATVNARSIHAWYGVAIPADIDPFLLGDAVPRVPKPPSKPTLWQKLGLSKGKADEEMERLVDSMVLQFGGEATNLHVVSGPRLLQELQAGLERSGLVDADALELYREVEDDDDESVARCYLAMSHRFLKEGMAREHLVWWIK